MNSMKFDGLNDFSELFGGFSNDILTPLSSDNSINANIDELSSDIEISENSNSKKKQRKASKSSQKSPIQKEFTCPITIYGIGWKTTYGEKDKKLALSDIRTKVCKYLFQNGYSGIINASITYSDNDIFINEMGNKASSDDSCMGSHVTIALGRKKFEADLSDFPGMNATEVSLFDLEDKFISVYPCFSGCSFNLEPNSQIASPILSEAKKLNDEQLVNLWTEEGILEGISISEIKESYSIKDATLHIYQSDNGTCFLGYSGKNTLTISLKDFEIEGVTRLKKSVELYPTDCRVVFATYASGARLSAEMFNGKEKVSFEEILDVLKNKWRTLRVAGQEYITRYDRQQRILAFSIKSGKKG